MEKEELWWKATEEEEDVCEVWEVMGAIGMIVAVLCCGLQLVQRMLLGIG